MTVGARSVQQSSPDDRERRRRDKEETRARVVDAARNLFAREGFERVTIRMIAEEAGVATGSVFITFTSKDELCDEIIGEYILALGDRLVASAAATAGQPLAARLLALSETVLDAPAERMTFIREAIAASWTRAEGAERKLRQAAAPICDTFDRVLSDGVAARELSPEVDRRCAAELLWLLTLNAFRAALYEGASLRQMRERLQGQLGVLLRGWSAQAC